MCVETKLRVASGRRALAVSEARRRDVEDSAGQNQAIAMFRIYQGELISLESSELF